MKKYIQENGINLFMFVITNIVTSDSEAIVLGDRTDLAEKAFNERIVNNRMLLKGVVSRKKQIFPNIIENA